MKDCKGVDGGHFSGHFVLGKARVTPLRGYTVPRSELSSGVLVSRMALRVARSLDSNIGEENTKSCLIMLDSECTIATLENSSKSLKPFFLNRKQEIIENLESIGTYCKVEPVHWIPTNLNVSDMLTRGTVDPGDIGLHSVWQRGPDFFLLPRERWPVSREFISNSKSVIPREEIRTVKDAFRVAVIKSQKLNDDSQPKLFRVVKF